MPQCPEHYALRGLHSRGAHRGRGLRASGRSKPTPGGWGCHAIVFLIWMLLGAKEVRPEVRPAPGGGSAPGPAPCHADQWELPLGRRALPQPRSRSPVAATRTGGAARLPAGDGPPLPFRAAPVDCLLGSEATAGAERAFSRPGGQPPGNKAQKAGTCWKPPRARHTPYAWGSVSPPGELATASASLAVLVGTLCPSQSWTTPRSSGVCTGPGLCSEAACQVGPRSGCGRGWSRAWGGRGGRGLGPDHSCIPSQVFGKGAIAEPHGRSPCIQSTPGTCPGLRGSRSCILSVPSAGWATACAGATLPPASGFGCRGHSNSS